MKRCIFLLCLAISCNYVNAQLTVKSYYVKGKIITESDTIDCYVEGKLVYRGKVNYKLDHRTNIPLKIDVAQIEHISTSFYQYNRVKVGKKSVLMKLITNGEIALYEYDYFTNANPPTHKSTHQLTGVHGKIRRKLYLVKDVDTYKVKKRKLHENLKQLMIDDTDLYADIEKLNYHDVLFDKHLKNLIITFNQKKKYN